MYERLLAILKSDEIAELWLNDEMYFSIKTKQEGYEVYLSCIGLRFTFKDRVFKEDDLRLLVDSVGDTGRLV